MQNENVRPQDMKAYCEQLNGHGDSGFFESVEKLPRHIELGVQDEERDHCHYVLLSI